MIPQQDEHKSTQLQIKPGCLLKAKGHMNLRTTASHKKHMRLRNISTHSLTPTQPIEKDSVVLLTSISTHKATSIANGGTGYVYETTATLYHNECDYAVSTRSPNESLTSIRTLYAVLYRLFDVVG